MLLYVVSTMKYFEKIEIIWNICIDNYIPCQVFTVKMYAKKKCTQKKKMSIHQKNVCKKKYTQKKNVHSPEKCILAVQEAHVFQNNGGPIYIPLEPLGVGVF